MIEGPVDGDAEPASREHQFVRAPPFRLAALHADRHDVVEPEPSYLDRPRPRAGQLGEQAPQPAPSVVVAVRDERQLEREAPLVRSRPQCLKARLQPVPERAGIAAVDEHIARVATRPVVQQ